MAKHNRRMRKTPIRVPVSNVLPFNNATLKVLLTNVHESPSLIALARVSVEVAECCMHEYRTNVNTTDVLKIAEATTSNQLLWKKERQFRITGSRCYSLYTYSKDNWAEKASNYFWPCEFSNKFVKHGLKMEPRARMLYQEWKNCDVFCCGLIISQNNPWLAYSPDGIVMQAQKPCTLIEIKCPWDLPDLLPETLLECCNYLIYKDKRLQLKQKHSYYGQVQFGLALLNLKACDFVIYSDKVNGIAVIPVTYDESFATNLLTKLKSVYFEKMLHVICQKNEHDNCCVKKMRKS
ncbi:uncharacterized protein [Fopius arisanus]|uniref:YqaJ viral recombinase domain-containing protein n=1 Tax=Fopius arisanus TaxID=64838 RepID=A0A9R1TMY1_9HYME|nr:PREDICTED: uncharacterized protein LOC105272002 [Fopius arisanus]